MSVTFALPTSDVNGATIRYLGYWVGNNFGGHTGYQLSGSQSQLLTNLNITTATNTVQVMAYTVTSNSLAVSIDGGAFTNPAGQNPGGSGWAALTLATNLSVGAHSIVIISQGGVLVMDVTYGIQVSDNSATLSPPTGISNQYLVQGPLATYGRFEGGFYPNGFGGYPSSVMLSGINQDSSIRFKTDATSIQIWAYGGGFTYIVTNIDTATIVTSPTVFSNNGLFQLGTVATGLSGLHEYEIRTTVNSNVGVNITHVMLPGGSLSTATPYTARDTAIFVGDSITAAITITPLDSRMGFAYKTTTDKSLAEINFGVGGYTTVSVISNMGYITAFPVSPTKKWFLLIGTNDISAGATTSDYQGRVTTIINSLQSYYTSATGYVIKILARNDAGNSSVPSFNAVLPAAIAATTSGGTGVNLIDISTGPGGTFTGPTDGDQVHPGPTDYTKLKNNLEAQVFGAIPGTITVNSTGPTTASLTATAATGGTSPYTYQWYRSTTNGFTPGGGNIISGATSLTLNDTGLALSTVYYYVITVTDATSAISNSVQATATTTASNLTSGTTTVNSVGSTTATLSLNSATLGTAPYTYQWYRSTTSGFTPGGGNILAGKTSLSLNDSGLTPLTTYYYKNIVTDSTSAAAVSNQSSLTTLAPGVFTAQQLMASGISCELAKYLALGNCTVSGLCALGMNSYEAGLYVSGTASVKNLMAFGEVAQVATLIGN